MDAHTDHVISDGRKSPVKATVKRKQQEFAATDAEVIKHARSTEADAADGRVLTDGSADRSLDHSWSKDSWWSATEVRTSEIQLLLERERQQSDDFEAYLRQALASTDSCKTSPVCDRSQQGSSVLGESEQTQGPLVQCGMSLTERISQLQNSITSEREADRLFELQLLHICLYD